MNIYGAAEKCGKVVKGILVTLVPFAIGMYAENKKGAGVKKKK